MLHARTIPIIIIANPDCHDLRVASLTALAPPIRAQMIKNRLDTLQVHT